MKELKKLIDLKSIITLSLTIAFVYGFIAGKIESKDFLIYIAMVYTYYFNKKENKEANEKEVG